MTDPLSPGRTVTGQYGSPESPGRDNPEPDTAAHPTPDLTDGTRS